MAHGSVLKFFKIATKTIIIIIKPKGKVRENNMGFRYKLVLFIVLILVSFNSEYVFAENVVWINVAKDIEKMMTDAVKDYESGKTNQAMEKVADAYFGVFEGEKANMEIAVRKFISLKKATELEKGFADIRKAMFNKVSNADIRKQVNNLTEALKESAKELDRKGVGMDVGY